jgi:hypothetical protein
VNPLTSELIHDGLRDLVGCIVEELAAHHYAHVGVRPDLVDELVPVSLVGGAMTDQTLAARNGQCGHLGLAGPSGVANASGRHCRAGAVHCPLDGCRARLVRADVQQDTARGQQEVVPEHAWILFGVPVKCLDDGVAAASCAIEKSVRSLASQLFGGRNDGT